MAWINPATGLGDEYIQYLNEIVPGHSSEAVIAVLLTIFGVAHSGLASLRPWAEEVIGARVRLDFPEPYLVDFQTTKFVVTIFSFPSILLLGFFPLSSH